MIQDIYPHKLYNQFDPNAKVCSDSRIISFDHQYVLLCIEDGVHIPTFEEAREKLNVEENQLRFLFYVDEIAYFLVDTIEHPEKAYEYIDLRNVRGHKELEKYHRYAIMTAKHLSDWYRDVKFCGRCGRPMIPSRTERAMVCPECNYTAYPRIMPAVIVGVKNGDKILLTKYRVGFRYNALIAGFVEIGETLEETVAREVMEEAGLRVKNIRYYKSQPWGIANDILTGFYCDVDGDDTITMDETELKYAEWVAREDIILQPDNSSLTNEMMMMFKEGIEK
ncbi:MAG: NAD(+) diphosphatase [Eubacteriales bacterium]|nr:NAD(+) diphosphatase [Eubacteriales bacterium]